MVDKALFETIKSKFPEGTSFKDAYAAGITDPQGNKIRHIRCYAPAVKNPLAIKKQTYLSKYPYKQNYYAAMGDLYVMCKYENISKTKTEYKIWSLFDISQNRKEKTPDVEDIPMTLTVEDKKHNTFVLNLVCKIRKGDMVLLYENSPDELVEADKNLLSQRLYVVTGFENPNYVKLVKHINAQKDSELGKGESVKSFDKTPEKIRQTITGLHYLIAGKDFDFSADFGIVFK
jgi:CRISPR-associated endonuclease Csn1